jgi:CheY-like chemotaxis protein
VRFEVEDTGVGIDPKDFERIFEPFRQLDESDSRRHGGLGAGLAVCRRLARLMGGDVTVQSGLGRGSVFSFDVHLGLERPTSTGDVAPQGEPARPRAARVLLADANPRTRAGSIGTLEQMGLRAQGVDDQAQLAESLDSGRFDVVLVDLDLPGDRPLASTLAERDLGSAYLVALATLEPGRAPSPPEGFHDLLPKPLRREQIVEILRKWSNTGPTSAPEAPPARPRA